VKREDAVGGTTSVSELAFWKDLWSLTKPRLAFLVLLTTAGGIGLAPVKMPLGQAISVVFFTFMMVGAANCLNCYIERRYDALMKRTCNRPLPQGRLPAKLALFLGWGSALIATVGLTWFGNVITAVLGVFACLSYALIYTPMKRKTAAALWVGAVPGALPPLMGWTAATGKIELGGLVLFGVLFLWQIPHFLAISLYLAEDYARGGFRVFSLVHGRKKTIWLIVLSTLCLVLAALSLVPLRLAPPAYGVIALLAGLIMWGWSLRGFWYGAEPDWARRMFMVSIFFMTALVGAILVFRGNGLV
jgi:heme o synthase